MVAGEGEARHLMAALDLEAAPPTPRAPSGWTALVAPLSGAIVSRQTYWQYERGRAT